MEAFRLVLMLILLGGLVILADRILGTVKSTIRSIA